LAFSHQRAPLFGAPKPGAIRNVRCGLGSFQFLGFDKHAIPTTLGRFDYVGQGRPPLLELEQVLFLPQLRCLYDLAGLRIEPSKVTYIEPGAPAWFNDGKISKVEQESMPAEITPPPGAQRIKEPVLFLGEAHDHYGHFLTDSLSRMWALDQFDPGCRILFAPDPKHRLDPVYVRPVLDVMGLDASRILRPQGPVVFDKVYCPIPALQLSRIYQMFDEPHVRATRVLMQGAQAPDRPVYLTRTGLSGGLRQPGAEAELELKLEREGFAVVRPEQLDLPSQMAIFNSDKPVVGAFGSAMHGVAFCLRPEGQRLAILFPPKIPPRFMMVDAAKGSRAAYLNCMDGEPVVAPDGGPGERQWIIDPDLAMAQLDAAGMLS
jgi:hypothetical protein